MTSLVRYPQLTTPQIEKLFDIACTLIDVITCVPLEASQSKSGAYLNTVLHLVQKLRGGASRYLPLLAARLHEIPNLAPPTQQMPLTITQGYAGASDHLPTPMLPQTNGSSHFPEFAAEFHAMRPPSVNGKGLMFDAYSPSTQAMSEASRSPHVARTPEHAARTPDGYAPAHMQIPRMKVERNNMYENYPG